MRSGARLFCLAFGSVVAVASVVGCASLSRTYPFWKGLGPYATDEVAVIAHRQLRAYCQPADAREALLSDMQVHLRSRELSFEEQHRAAAVVAALMEDPNAQSNLVHLLREVNGNTDFIAAMLFTPAMYGPNYIENTISFFGRYGDVPVRLLDHDGSVSKMEMSALVARGLRKATGKSFGAEEATWQKWWGEKGRYLEFDSRSGRYQGRGDGSDFRAAEGSDLKR